jgi:hypothetical protein
MQKLETTADTPLSALFRKEHQEMLRGIIEDWRSALIIPPEEDVLKTSTFFFDFDSIRPIEVYMDLVELIIHGGLRYPMTVLARYMASHSNLSNSECSLYTLLKRYKRLCEQDLVPKLGT